MTETLWYEAPAATPPSVEVAPRIDSLLGEILEAKRQAAGKRLQFHRPDLTVIELQALTARLRNFDYVVQVRTVRHDPLDETAYPRLEISWAHWTEASSS